MGEGKTSLEAKHILHRHLFKGLNSNFFCCLLWQYWCAQHALLYSIEKSNCWQKSKVDLLLVILTIFAPSKRVQRGLGFDTIQSIGIPVVTNCFGLDVLAPATSCKLEWQASLWEGESIEGLRRTTATKNHFIQYCFHVSRCFVGICDEQISHLEMDAKAAESTNKFSKVIRNHETSDKNGLWHQSSPLERTKILRNTLLLKKKRGVRLPLASGVDIKWKGS